MTTINLPYQFTLRDYQEGYWNWCLKEEFKRALIVWPRRNGKDIVSLNILVAKAMQKVALYYYIGPYYNQIRQIIWEGIDGSGKRFIDYIPAGLVEKKTKIDMRINLVNGSQIKLCGSDNIDSIVGTNPYGVIFTEFSLHKPEAWHFIRPILAENGGWAIFNGTPRGLNHFFTLAQRAEKHEGWFFQKLTRDDTNIPSLEAIEEDRRSGMPESLIEQEYYTSWVSSTEETLIPLDIVEPSVDLALRPEDYNFAPKILGVDVAYAAKGDKAVIAKRQGRKLHPLLKFQGKDNMSLASRVGDMIKSWKPDAVFVDYGRGEGVIHRLWQLGYRDVVIPVNFAQKPYSRLYLNKRAEIHCRMRDWFLAANIPSIPNDENLIASITAATFDPNDRGYIQIESKKMIRKRLGSSPDDSDAVALTFSEELRGEKVRGATHLTENELALKLLHEMQSNEETQYDPLNYFNDERNSYNGQSLY